MPAARQAVGPRYPTCSSRTGRSSVKSSPWADAGTTGRATPPGASPVPLTPSSCPAPSQGEVSAGASPHQSNYTEGFTLRTVRGGQPSVNEGDRRAPRVSYNELTRRGHAVLSV